MSLKVLVIDDHPLVQQGVAAALESLGHETQVMSARDAEQGMAMAAANPDLDLVLLDLLLPELDGLSVLRELQKARPELPVVIVSARSDLPTKLRGFGLGAAGVLHTSGNTMLMPPLPLWTIPRPLACTVAIVNAP